MGVLWVPHDGGPNPEMDAPTFKNFSTKHLLRNKAAGTDLQNAANLATQSGAHWAEAIAR